MTTIAVYRAFRSAADDIRSRFPEDDILILPDDGGLAAAAQAEIALCSSNRDAARNLLRAAPKLRWYQSVNAGVDSIVPEFRARDIILTNNRGSYTVPVAEHVMMFLFAVSQGLPLYLDQQQRKEWRVHERHGELSGSTIVIYGVGDIGGEIARLTANVGMRVIGVRRQGEPIPGVAIVVAPDKLPTVVADADYLVIAAPLTPATRGAVSRDVIARMKRSAWVLNIARGAIIDEAALIDALRERRIAGAALDAFQSEPLPVDSPLWSLDNVIVTPHVAANSNRVRERTLGLFAENLRRFKIGLPLVNVVNLDVGY